MSNDINIISGEKRIIRKSWAQETERAGTTVTASTWTYAGTATLSNATLVTPVCTVLITPTSSGTLTNTVTFANAEVRTECFYFEVSDAC